VETLLTHKKQLLEDITKEQILTNRWKLEERERQEFEKTLGWSKFSKEDTTKVKLVEIQQVTATGFTLQEILPQGDHPHSWINQTETTSIFRNVERVRKGWGRTTKTRHDSRD
jgi:hypothetical protein